MTSRSGWRKAFERSIISFVLGASHAGVSRVLAKGHQVFVKRNPISSDVTGSISRWRLLPGRCDVIIASASCVHRRSNFSSRVTVRPLLIAVYTFVQAAFWSHFGTTDVAEPASVKRRPRTIRLAMVITRMSRRNVQRRFCNVLPVWFPAGETNERVDQSSARKSPQQYRHK